jgi:hypothetical protein
MVARDQLVLAALHFQRSQMSNDITLKFVVIESSHRAAVVRWIVRH